MEGIGYKNCSESDIKRKMGTLMNHCKEDGCNANVCFGKTRDIIGNTTNTNARASETNTDAPI